MTLAHKNAVIKVAIVSHNSLLLVGTRRIFEENIGIVIVGEWSGLSSARNLITDQRPDVILVDIESDMKFAEAINNLRQNNQLSQIIVLSGWDEIDRARQALAAGADEIVMKCQHPGVLLATVKCVRHAGKGLAVALKATLSQAPNTNRPLITDKVDNGKAVVESTRCTDALTDALTDREREVIVLVGKGLSNRDIANSLCIAETTVRHHLTSIFDKMGVSSRQKLLIHAYQSGLVELTSSA
jgi:DNA-binding NarL/FixJ family response regulator